MDHQFVCSNFFLHTSFSSVTNNDPTSLYTPEQRMYTIGDKKHLEKEANGSNLH